MIPQASSSSLSLGGHGYQDEGYDDGHPGMLNTTASTIYPDTVPHLTNAQMHSAITDDLRRAIGGMSINDSEGERLDANGLRYPSPLERLLDDQRLGEWQQQWPQSLFPHKQLRSRRH